MNGLILMFFESVLSPYLPDVGQGETMATQISTAVNKLVYKWFNDGDVFDNTYGMTGWANDLSSYANWLDKNTECGAILAKIGDCYTEDDYTVLLYDLCKFFSAADMERFSGYPAEGSVYDCDGDFKFELVNDEEEEWY